MARVTGLQIAEPEELRLKWSRGLSLTARILAVNLFALVPVAGGLLFLDSYRGRLVEERRQNAISQVQLLERSLPMIDAAKRPAFIRAFGEQTKSRIRIYDAQGSKSFDSFSRGKPVYRFINPDEMIWQQRAALALDDGFDFLVGASTLPEHVEPGADRAAAWSEISANDIMTRSIARAAPDGGHVISAGKRDSNGSAILSTSYAPDILGFFRTERFRVGMFFLVALAISVLLSLFLARTIAKPLRHLARAAVKVRLGRAPGVTVPRLPSRRDEIGMLARALSDMSLALNKRINATEAFAADVAHEIKNPLASLRSALDGVESSKTQEVQSQLLTIAKADVRRLDRLISDISEAGRVDSQLAQAKFEQIDLGAMIEQLIAAHGAATATQTIRFRIIGRSKLLVMGEDIRLERVLSNLIDNARSFSPENGLIDITGQAEDENDEIVLRVIDEGPGVLPDQRDAIFNRFYSMRPDGEDFGQHSGLGLAIARNIIEGHHGQIIATDRPDGKNGACFEIRLPKADDSQ